MSRRLVTGPRIIGVIVLIVVALAIYVALRVPPAGIEIGRVSRGALVVTIDDVGETRVTDLFVVSAPVTGEVLRVPLKPGDKVIARSTILARVQPLLPAPLDARSAAQSAAKVRALEDQLAAAQSRVSEVRTEGALAARDYDRVQALAERGFVSRATVDHARSTRARFRASLAAANQSAEAVRHELEAARAALMTPGSDVSGRGAVAVTSPVSGHVLRVPQESERVVVAGTPLVEIGDPDRLEMVTDFLSSDAVRIRPGAEVAIDDWGGERPLRGRVRRVEPFGFTKVSALGVEEQRVNVVADFVEPRAAFAQLGHGYRATVRVTVSSAPDVVRVPISALFRSGSAWTVFVVENKRARLRRVEIGAMNDDLAEVRRGLAVGEQVILHPGDTIKDGVPVQPL